MEIVMKVNTAFAEAFVNAAAATLKKDGEKVDHRRWVARHVADRVLNTELGTVNIPSVLVEGTKGTMVRM
jgi:hypothetical protein